jgi:hypothetical protein
MIISITRLLTWLTRSFVVSIFLIRVLLVQLPLMSQANEYILVLFVIVHHLEPNVRRLFSQLVWKPRRYQLE